MKNRAWSIILGLTMMGLILGAALSAQDLKKFGLDEASSYGLKIAADTAVKVEGKASARVTTAWPLTACLAQTEALDIEDAGLLFKAKVKTDMQGEAYLEMWVQVAGKQYFSRGLNSLVKGKSDWTPILTQFFLNKGQKPEKVWLNIVINGMGTVWVDDLVLTKGPRGGTRS